MAESDGAMESGDRLSIATDPILIPRYYRIAFESNFFILSLYIPLQRGYKQSVEYRMFKITRCRNVVKSCIYKIKYGVHLKACIALFAIRMK